MRGKVQVIHAENDAPVSPRSDRRRDRAVAGLPLEVEDRRDLWTDVRRAARTRTAVDIGPFTRPRTPTPAQASPPVTGSVRDG